LNNQEDLPFACECDEAMHRACKDEPFFGEREGKRYCVLHFPGTEKKEAFDAAVEKKLKSKDFNYQGVWFPKGRWFRGLEIPEPAYFSFATFDGAASFRKTVFRSSAHFDHATFIDHASFNPADFDSAVFEGSAKFGHA
jgi:hypothetical protein